MSLINSTSAATMHDRYSTARMHDGDKIRPAAQRAQDLSKQTSTSVKTVTVFSRIIELIKNNKFNIGRVIFIASATVVASFIIGPLAAVIPFGAYLFTMPFEPEGNRMYNDPRK